MDQLQQKFFDKTMMSLLGSMVLLGILMLVFGPPDSLDTRFYYSGEEARAVLRNFSDADLNSYFVNELFDLCFIYNYVIALKLALGRLYRCGTWTLALPLIVGISDFIETSVVISVLKLSVSQAVFDWLGVFTCLKWSFGAIAMGIVVCGLALKRR